MQLNQIHVGPINSNLNLQLVSTNLVGDISVIFLLVNSQQITADFVDSCVSTL
jgi:hypothetical protein